MIAIDTSAVIAIFRQEDDAARHADCIARDEAPLMSAASVLEASMVLRALRSVPAEEAERWLDDFMSIAGITVEPVTGAQVRLAREAHRRFGKGTGHPANLNFGDCFAYALARSLDVALLFKGEDFGLTDIIGALPPP